jgi:glucose dehydrogenase
MNVSINGKNYPAVVGCNKAAFCEALDRRNGRAIPNFPMKEVKVQAGLAVNNEWPTQPEGTGAMYDIAPRCVTAQMAAAAYPTYPIAPNGTPLTPACEQDNSVNTEYRIEPGNAGAVNYARSAYNPLTNDWYVCTNTDLTGYENVSPTDWHVNTVGGGILSSQLSAVNMSSNKMDWQRVFAGSQYTAATGNQRQDGVNPGMPNGVWSAGCAVTGVMTTAGNLVFVSAAGNTNCGCIDTSTTAGGVLFAFNAKTGEGPLWSWQAPDGINANPMTYEVNGKQYIVIYARGHGPGSRLSDGRRDLLTVFSL